MSEPPPSPMTSVEANWFVRTAAARWMTWLLEQDDAARL